jgi:serine/threonine protein kinase
MSHCSDLVFPFERSNMKLGAGGNGEVWLGRHIVTNNLVALKKCFMRSFSSSPELSSLGKLSKSEAYQREICPGEHVMLHRHPHPNIVPMLGCCPTPSAAYIALGLQDSDLSVEISAGRTRLSEDVAKLLMHPVISAIAFLHQSSVVHRDIKPSNILLRRDRSRVLGAHVSLGDFGQAHYVALPAEEGCEDEVFIPGGGTCYYQSPELLVGRVPPSGSYKCDMWAVGCTLYEILTGVAAFSGANQIQVIHMIHKRMGTDYNSFPAVVAPQSILDPLRHCSEACQSLLMGLLELDPQRRLSADEVLRHPFFAGVEELSQMSFSTEELPDGPLLDLRGFGLGELDTSQCKFKPVVIEATPTSISAFGAAAEEGGPPTVGIHLVRNLNLSDESSIHVTGDQTTTTTTIGKGGLLVTGGGAGGGGDASCHHLAYSNMRTTALFGDLSGQGCGYSPANGSSTVSPPRAVKALQFEQSPSPPPTRSRLELVSY